MISRFTLLLWMLIGFSAVVASVFAWKVATLILWIVFGVISIVFMLSLFGKSYRD